MLKSSKFILVIFSVIAIVILGSAYKILKQQYSDGITQKETPALDYLNLDETTEDETKDSIGDSGLELEEESEPEAKEDANINNELYLTVTNKDCAEKCSAFKEDAENFKYCRNFCGLNPINKKITSCDSLEELEKDYCFKDLAITKKDFTACENIVDSGIKKTCKNRVTEEVLNGNEDTTEIIN